MRLQELQARLERDIVVSIRLAGASHSVRQAIRKGNLIAVLPGIYADAAIAAEPLTRMRALHLYSPEAVLTGASAGALLWDATLANGTITATGRLRSRHPGFEINRRSIDADWITSVDGISCTNAPLTAVELIPTAGADFVDRVLRDAGHEGAEALRQMWLAHGTLARRPGHALRESILTESRDLPWSALERRAHADLRAAGIVGWTTNHPVVLGGEVFFIDLAFPQLQLAIELDGFEHHSSRAAFERDRHKQNALVVAGWNVIRLTWSMVMDEPGGWLGYLNPWLPSSVCG